MGEPQRGMSVALYRVWQVSPLLVRVLLTGWLLLLVRRGRPFFFFHPRPLSVVPATRLFLLYLCMEATWKNAGLPSRNGAPDDDQRKELPFELGMERTRTEVRTKWTKKNNTMHAYGTG